MLSGKDRIDLYYFGRGHTDNDIFVVYPNERVMNVGDLMAWDMAPLIDPGTNGSVLALPDTMDGAAKGIKNIDQIITGHGDVYPRQTMLDYASYMRDLVNESKKGLAAGQTPDEVLAALQKVELAKDAKRARYFTHDNQPGLEYGQSPATRTLININVAYQELSGEPVHDLLRRRPGRHRQAQRRHRSEPALAAPRSAPRRRWTWRSWRRPSRRRRRPSGRRRWRSACGRTSCRRPSRRRLIQTKAGPRSRLFLWTERTNPEPSSSRTGRVLPDPGPRSSRFKADRLAQIGYRPFAAADEVPLFGLRSGR